MSGWHVVVWILPWEKAKAFDGSAFVGKWFDKSTLGDLGKLPFSLQKNGEEVCRESTSAIYFFFVFKRVMPLI